MTPPQGYWHLTGRARQIAKAKFIRYYEDNRATNPVLVFDDLCRKYHLTPPSLEVSFVADGRLLLRRGDRSQLLAVDAPIQVVRPILNSLSRPAQAAGSTHPRNESTNV